MSAGVLLGLALLVAVVGWAVLIGRPDFPLDDAYITLHNAEVLLAGRDPNYGVSPLTGATSSVHLLLVALLGRVIGLPWSAAAIAWLAAALYLAGLLVYARRVAISPIATAALVAAGALCGMSLYHLLNGLETGLAMAAIVWAMVLASGPSRRLLPALLGIMPFIRPELALLAVPLLARQVWIRWKAGERRAIAGDLALAALAGVPWVVWMWSETGSIVPQTAGAKRAFFAEATLPAMAKLASVTGALGAFALQVGPLMLGLVGLRSAPAGRAAIVFVVAMLALFGATLPGGLYHNWSRYLYLLPPLLLIGLASALGRATTAGGRRASIAVLLMTAVFALATLPLHGQRYRDEIAFTRTELAGVAAWIRNNLPPGAKIAVHDAGYLAYATDREMVDIVGLKTPAAQAAHEAITAPSNGERRGAALARILAEAHAAYLVVSREWDAIFALTAGLRAAGVALTPVRSEGAYLVFRIGNAP